MTIYFLGAMVVALGSSLLLPLVCIARDGYVYGKEPNLLILYAEIGMILGMVLIGVTAMVWAARRYRL